MENPFFAERPPVGHEQVSGDTDSLPERLGFVETDALRAIRQHASELFAADDCEGAASLVREYQLLGEELVSHLGAREYSRGQIGLIVATAMLRRDAGDLEGFLNDIGKAKEYAFNAYENDTVAFLEPILKDTSGID